MGSVPSNVNLKVPLPVTVTLNPTGDHFDEGVNVGAAAIANPERIDKDTIEISDKSFIAA